MVCELHQIHGMFIYVASVNIINIFHSELLILCTQYCILCDVYFGFNWTYVLKNFSISGFYNLTCSDCTKAYIGQTDSFYKDVQWTQTCVMNNSSFSKFAQHLNEYILSFGAINGIMQILHYHKKGPHLDKIVCF